MVIALRLCAVHCYANWHVKEKMIDTLAGRLVCGKEATSSMHGAGMYCTVTVGMFQQREWQSDNRRGFCLTVVACLCLSLSRPGQAPRNRTRRHRRALCLFLGVNHMLGLYRLLST